MTLSKSVKMASNHTLRTECIELFILVIYLHTLVTEVKFKPVNQNMFAF